jgi:hypothetical protein
MKAFYRATAVLLLMTAAAKVISASGNQEILRARDPIFNLHLQYVLLISAALEIAVALVCLVWQSVIGRAAIVSWLGLSFIAYRLGLVYLRYSGPCPCLGTLTDRFNISHHAADIVLNSIIAFMLAGSAVCAYLSTRNKETVELAIQPE